MSSVKERIAQQKAAEKERAEKAEKEKAQLAQRRSSVRWTPPKSSTSSDIPSPITPSNSTTISEISPPEISPSREISQNQTLDVGTPIIQALIQEESPKLVPKFQQLDDIAASSSSSSSSSESSPLKTSDFESTPRPISSKIKDMQSRMAPSPQTPPPSAPRDIKKLNLSPKVPSSEGSPSTPELKPKFSRPVSMQLPTGFNIASLNPHSTPPELKPKLSRPVSMQLPAGFNIASLNPQSAPHTLGRKLEKEGDAADEKGANVLTHATLSRPLSQRKKPSSKKISLDLEKIDLGVNDCISPTGELHLDKK